MSRTFSIELLIVVFSKSQYSIYCKPYGILRILEYEKIKVKTAPCLSTSIVAIINVSQVVNTNWWKYEGKVREFL